MAVPSSRTAGARFAQTLTRASLIDENRLNVHPTALAPATRYSVAPCSSG